MLTTWSVTRAENWRAHGFVTTRYFSVHNKPSVASYEALLKEREYKLIAQEVEFINRSWWDYFDKKKTSVQICYNTSNAFFDAYWLVMDL